MRKPKWLYWLPSHYGASVLGLLILTTLALVATSIMALTGNSRLPWMVMVALLFLFLSALNRLRIRVMFKAFQKDVRLRRQAHADRGKVIHFPNQKETKDGG